MNKLLDEESEAVERMYRVAQHHGEWYVSYLNVCFDGGDDVDTASELLGSLIIDQAIAKVEILGQQ